MAEFVENPDWREQIREDTVRLLEQLSASGLEKAQRACPVSRDGSNGNPPGHLRHSLRKAVDSENLSAAWGTDLNYGLYVEEGHRVAYRDSETGDTIYTGDVVAPQPFLRPSLYDLGGA